MQADQPFLIFINYSVVQLSSTVLLCGLVEYQRRIVKTLKEYKKNAFKIIFGRYFTDYHEVLVEAEESTLNTRRDILSLDFAKKRLKSTKFNSWFVKGMNTRNGSYFSEPNARTNIYRNSPIPFMTRLLNQHFRT